MFPLQAHIECIPNIHHAHNGVCTSALRETSSAVHADLLTFGRISMW